MYSEHILIIMQKQNLTTYLSDYIHSLKKSPNKKPEPILVQVLSHDLITDGCTNFPCLFKNSPRKGSYLRLISWEV